jgi:hypothetical protein
LSACARASTQSSKAPAGKLISSAMKSSRHHATSGRIRSRVHPKAQASALRGLLAEVGYADALIARELPDGKLQLINGHLRAKTTPNAIVPVLVLDVSEEEADKLLLTLDPLAGMAEADAGRIKALLATVRTDSVAVGELLERIAGEEAWLSVNSAAEVQDPEPQIERAAELQIKWGTALGQLWKIDWHRLLCGDCRDRKRLPPVHRHRCRGRHAKCFQSAEPGRRLGRRTRWSSYYRRMRRDFP